LGQIFPFPLQATSTRPFIVQPSIGSAGVKLALRHFIGPWRATLFRYALLCLRHQGRDGRGPQTKEKTMSHTLIPTSEIEDLGEEALQSKFCALRNDLLRAEGMRTMALASLQTVQAELNRKRALKSRYPAPRW